MRNASVFVEVPLGNGLLKAGTKLPGTFISGSVPYPILDLEKIDRSGF